VITKQEIEPTSLLGKNTIDIAVNRSMSCRPWDMDLV
jgi:hypothetical protein